MKAAVVGCGMGGMAAALAMRRAGYEVTIFEAFETPKPVGSGLLLQPSGLAALRWLGLEDAILSDGARVDRLIGHDLSGRVLLDLNYRYWRPGSHGLGINRTALFDRLMAAVKGADIALVTGTRVDGLEDPARPRLSCQGRELGSFDLAVIADGSGSSLRGQLRPGARAPVYPWGAVWANCPCPQAFDGALTQLYRRADMMIGVLPIGGGLASLFWSLPVARMDSFFAGEFDAWRGEVAGHWPQVAPMLASLSGFGDLSRATYRDVRLGRWNNGACIIIGDAAHGTSPQLGQGANMALIDAVELGQHLAAARSPLIPGLGAYQARRRRHTGLYQLASRSVTPMFQSSSRVWPWVRDNLMVPASRLPMSRRIAGGLLAGTLRLGRFPKDSRP